MRRQRAPADAPNEEPTSTGRNNTRSLNGYDAYFGRYTVDETSHTVTQVLHGALALENVGIVVTRQMEVDGEILTLRLPTTAASGERVVRTLQWRRCPTASEAP
jgi:hypothetical protein